MHSLEKFNKYMITEFLGKVPPLVVDHAEGATIVDVDAKEYVDAFAGISVCNAGHNNPHVVAAAREQLGKLIHCCTYALPHAPAADLAELLAEITPGRLSRTFFGNSGAEANEAAMRLAKEFTGKTEFIALAGAFHGRTLATLSVSGLAGRKRRGGPYMPGVSFIPAPYCYRCALGKKTKDCNLACARMLEETIQCSTSGNVAAMIVEPIQGEGGIIVPPAGWFKVIKETLDRHQILMIVDEVQTGFGRTGNMFAIEAEEIEPDIMTLGKGIADGFPLSAMITRPEIAAAFKPGDHLSTFGGNPVSCAAALASINFYQSEKLPEQASAKGETFVAQLKKLLKTYPAIGDIRARGLMIGIELIKPDGNEPDAALARQIQKRCREAGVLIGVGGRVGNVLRIQPPLVISNEQLEVVAQTLTRTLSR